MSMDLLPYSIVFFCTSFITAWISVVSWKRRNKAGGWPLAALMLAASEWSFSSGVEALVDTAEAKILWSQIEYIGFACIGTLMFLFTMKYANRSSWFTRRRMIALWTIPVITLFMVWTNPLHGLMWPSFSFDTPGLNVLTYHHGFWFWFFIVYTYAMTLAGLMVLIYTLYTAPLIIKHQATAIIVGSMFPFLTGLAYVTGLTPIPGIDISALGFSMTGIIIAWGLYRLKLLDLVPVGRAALVESIPDGILVLDEKSRIADINPAALRIFGIHGGSPVGRDVRSVLSSHSDIAVILCRADESHTEAKIAMPDTRYFEISVLPLRDQRDVVHGRLVIMRDITARTIATLEQKHTIAELRKALAEIKTLSGLLPICSSCKKIRSDEGYWTQIEAYIKEHSDADFTHGICPDCAKKLYPDYYDRKMNRDKKNGDV